MSNFALSHSGNPDPDPDMDHFQKLITSKLGPSCDKIFMSNCAN